MAATPESQHPVDVPTSAPNAVRKQVTALFGDLVGATSFGERVDPEAARAALAPYFEILRSTIEDHAGTVVKFTGDGVLAIFGVPEVAEDDALRAVAAGLELQHRFRAFADGVRDQHGVELGLRVGINTGELVMGDGDADLVGDVLNTAARLEAACQPGRVMVGEDTWRLTRSNVSYEVLGEVRVKGKSDALATFQVVDDDDADIDDATPFVGRSDELDVLRSAFIDAVESSVARLVTVVGSPGVGKTRLAAELRTGVEARTFDLRFERRGSTTFTPIVELLREVTRTGSADDIALLVADHPEAGRLSGVLSSFLGHGEARSTEESFWAVRRLLEHLAANEPVVVVVDDIQWAEPLFWDLLEHLVEWTESPVLLVALARPELRELRPELTQVGKRVSASVSLDGLDADTTRELAARLLDTDELPADLIERIPDSTEGNPLFVRELIQMLVDDGVLELSGDRWHLTIDADAIEVPPTVLSLLASRVERLPDDERQVVELASVIGTEFDRGLLGAIAGPEVSTRLGALIDRLRRKDLVEPSAAWAGDHPVYRFHHVLVRDAAYRRLLKAHRAALHERVGRYTDALHETGDGADVVVAFHYEQVHRYRSDLGIVDDDTRALALHAAECLQRAAQQALDREDLTAAGSFAERALDLTVDPAQRSELLLLGCEALLASGDVARAAPLVEALSGHATGDDRFDSWADCFRAQLWSLTDADRLTEAEQLADGAAGTLDALGDQAGVAKARLVRASCLARLGRVGDCEDELDLALGAARAAADRRRTVAVLGAAPLAALWGPSPVARAGGRCLDVLRLLRITTSSPAVEATAVRCQGVLEALRGRFDSARTKLEESRATAREIGLRQGLFETELFAGFVELLANDPATAEPHLRAAHDGLGRLGIGADAGQAAALLARALLQQGRVDEADLLASEALASAGQNLQTAMAARSALAEVRAAQGRHREASELIAEVVGIAERTDVTLDHALVEAAASVVAAAAAHHPASASHDSRAAALLAAKGVTLDLRRVLASVTQSQPASPSPTEADGSDVGASFADAFGTPEGPANAASRRSATGIREMAAGNRAAFVERYREDAEIRLLTSLEHSVFAHQVLDREQFADAALSTIEGELSTQAVVAVRGDDLFLGLLIMTSPQRRRFYFQVMQTDGSNAIRHDVYGPDQVWDAIDRLDELWLGSNATVSARSQYLRAISTGEADAIRAVVADDFTSVDHRHSVRGRCAREAWTQAHAALDGAGPAIVPVEVIRHESHGDDVVELGWFRTLVDDTSSDSLRVVWSRGSLLMRADVFDVDDAAGANSLVDEIVADLSSSGVSQDADDPWFANEAWRTGEDLLGLIERGATRSEVLATFHDDFTSRGSERFDLGEVLDAPAWLDSVLQIINSAANSESEAELLAVRGEAWALGRLRSVIDGSVVEKLRILHVEDGLIRSFQLFDPDQLAEAVQELDRLWSESGRETPSFAASRRVGEVLTRGDRDEYRNMFADDFLAVDHQRIGMGTRTADQMVESAPSGDGELTTFAVHFLGIAEFHTLFLTDMRVGETDSNWRMLCLLAVDPDTQRLTTVETFDESDCDAALARFHELESSGSADDPARGDTVGGATFVDEFGLANDAWRTNRSFVEGYRGGSDRDDLLQLFCDDFTSQSRLAQRLDLGHGIDADGLIDAFHSLAPLHGSTAPPLDFELLATRGDDLCLLVVGMHVGIAESRRFVVVRTVAGRMASLDWFEEDRRPEAFAELDRRWDETFDVIPRSVVNVRRWIDTMTNGDVSSYRALYGDDMVSIDHRPIGLGTRSADEMAQSMAPLLGRMDVVTIEVIAFDDQLALTLPQARVRDDDSQFKMLVVWGFDPETDLIRNFEMFDESDRAAALTRFHELAGASPPAAVVDTTDELANRAVRIVHDLDVALRSGDLERAIGLLDERFASSGGHRADSGGALDRDAFIDDMQAALADANVTRVAIAVRGDDLVLIRFGNTVDGHASALVVLEADGERLVSARWFDVDRSNDAQIHLDRRYLKSIGVEPGSVRWRLASAPYELDPDRFGEWLHPDFELVDRRSMSWPGGDRRDTLDQMTGDVAHFVTVPRVLHLTEAAGALWRVEHLSEFDEVHMYCAYCVEDDLLRNLEFFDTEQEAIARFDEFDSSGGSGTGGGLPELTNEAWRVSQRSDELFAAGDRAALEELMHEDVIIHSTNQLRLRDVLDRQRFLDQWANVFESEGLPTRTTTTLLAVRGEWLCLEEGVVEFGDAVTVMLQLTRVENGRIVELWFFDRDGLHDALDELERQFGQSTNEAPPTFETS